MRGFSHGIYYVYVLFRTEHRPAAAGRASSSFPASPALWKSLPRPEIVFFHYLFWLGPGPWPLCARWDSMPCHGIPLAARGSSFWSLKWGRCYICARVSRLVSPHLSPVSQCARYNLYVMSAGSVRRQAVVQSASLIICRCFCVPWPYPVLPCPISLCVQVSIYSMRRLSHPKAP